MLITKDHCVTTKVHTVSSEHRLDAWEVLHKYIYKQHTIRVCFRVTVCGMMLYLIELRFKASHSKEESVILQVQTVFVTTVDEVFLREELWHSPTNCSLALCDTSFCAFRYIISTGPKFLGAVLPILQLVEQAHFDGPFEGPLQNDVIVSSHQADAQRHMSALPFLMTI